MDAGIKHIVRNVECGYTTSEDARTKIAQVSIYAHWNKASLNVNEFHQEPCMRLDRSSLGGHLGT